MKYLRKLTTGLGLFMIGFAIGAYSENQDYENLETVGKTVTAATGVVLQGVGDLIGEPKRKGDGFRNKKKRNW